MTKPITSPSRQTGNKAGLVLHKGQWSGYSWVSLNNSPVNRHFSYSLTFATLQVTAVPHKEQLVCVFDEGMLKTS